MFDISWGEFLLIGVVALVAIGPKELPGVLRTVGQWMTKLRRLASEFQGQFHEAIREAEMADLKKEVDEMTDKAKSYAHFDPIGDIQKDIENTIADKPPESSSAAVSSDAAGAPVSEPAAEPSASVSPAVTPEPAAPESGAPELRHDTMPGAAMPDAGAKPA